MHLRFARHGLQFFFLTICVRGRQAVLLRLVEGEKRPVLSRAGEWVKTLWLALWKAANPDMFACRQEIGVPL